MELLVKYHDATMPELKITEVGDWIDLYTADTYTLSANEYKLLSLGVSMKAPKGYEIHLAPRSSTFKNFKILQTNSVGVIDESYCGDNDIIHFPALAMSDTFIPKHTRIAQIRLVKTMRSECEGLSLTKVDTLGNKDRGGFGSSGTGAL